MREKSLLCSLIFVILLGGVACSKKQTESNQAQTQTPATEAPSTQQASTTPAQPAQPSTAQPQTPTATPSAVNTPEDRVGNHPVAAVPAGTALVVRLKNAVSSKTARAGETFTATVDKAVIVQGQTLIPRGAAVIGRVTDVKAAGKISGAAQLGLKLTSITVGGKSYKVSSNAIAQTSTGKGKRTAVLGGGGAVLGGAVGGLAGGRKGAVLGLLAGGGAGTAGSALTGDADITLPAESMLSFRLSQPLDFSQPPTSSTSK